jgi:hypothetical protein
MFSKMLVKLRDMKKLFVYLILTFFSQFIMVEEVCAQLSSQQKYLAEEIRDAFGGQIYYVQNYEKTRRIYEQLISYSRMRYAVIFAQTFNWGQAHRGGLIIIDYSTRF